MRNIIRLRVNVEDLEEALELKNKITHVEFDHKANVVNVFVEGYGFPSTRMGEECRSVLYDDKNFEKQCI